MKYKKGDRVKLKPYNDEFDDDFGTNDKMVPLFGTYVTITDITDWVAWHEYYDEDDGDGDGEYDGRYIYRIKEDGGEWVWSSDWFEMIEVRLPEELFRV